ncbi:MAG TPA: S-layer homology domain-containing protein [Fimbriimonas sp.]|nr:S-layer homology domain-containing protein [Fimbriimonas sp.]
MFLIGPIAFAVLGLPALQDNFPDVPSNHWARVGVDRLRMVGLLPPDNRLIIGPWPDSRLDMARQVVTAAKRLRGIEQDFLVRSAHLAIVACGTKQANEERARLCDLQLALKGQRDDMVLKKASAELLPELHTLKATATVDLAIAQYRPSLLDTKIPEPGSALKQFQDVPSNHWAAKAVRDLRSEGILQGYPDNLFR